MTAQQAEQLATRIAGMDRPALVRTLQGLNCTFEMDFGDKALSEMDLGRLKHVVLAAALRAQGPDEPED